MQKYFTSVHDGIINYYIVLHIGSKIQGLSENKALKNK